MPRVLHLVSSCITVRNLQYHSAFLGRQHLFMYTAPGFPHKEIIT